MLQFTSDQVTQLTGPDNSIQINSSIITCQHEGTFKTCCCLFFFHYLLITCTMFSHYISAILSFYHTNLLCTIIAVSVKEGRKHQVRFRLGPQALLKYLFASTTHSIFRKLPRNMYTLSKSTNMKVNFAEKIHISRFQLVEQTPSHEWEIHGQCNIRVESTQ